MVATRYTYSENCIISEGSTYGTACLQLMPCAATTACRLTMAVTTRSTSEAMVSSSHTTFATIVRKLCPPTAVSVLSVSRSLCHNQIPSLSPCRWYQLWLGADFRDVTHSCVDTPQATSSWLARAATAQCPRTAAARRPAAASPPRTATATRNCAIRPPAAPSRCR